MYTIKNKIRTFAHLFLSCNNCIIYYLNFKQLQKFYCAGRSILWVKVASSKTAKIGALFDLKPFETTTVSNTLLQSSRSLVKVYI